MRALVVALAVCLAAPVLADTDQTITVTGEARVAAAPDMARLSLGATGRGADPITAMNHTSAVLDVVIARLQSMGLEPRDIQTSSAQLNRRARWDRDKEQEVFLGYEANNSLTIRVRDLSQLGGVLGAVLEDGANSLSNLTWAVQDPAPLEDKARREAVQDAMAKAALYAEAAGVELGQVLMISDSAAAGIGPSMRGAAPVMEAMAADVPVVAGEIEASARVTMVFAIGN